ncbi:MAG: sigma-70 family RNA polymerase sigma factor [Roseivirga sp.]|nr:sigma-70 family RNA polymerase sigma factor [Roseivirga sp.]
MDNFVAHNTLDHLFRHEYSKLVAMLTNRYGVALLDLVEDAVQEALLKASKVWSYQPMPDRPGAWLYRVANNQMIDFLRREKKSVDYETNYADKGADEKEFELQEDVIKDEMLKMIFACCHPSLKAQEQLMLSLKLLCGLSVREIARALLKSEEGTKKAIQRAKQKFKTEVGDLQVPREEEIGDRLNAVLQVIYLLFNEGYKATSGEKLMKQELCEEAIRLAFLMLNEGECNTNELNALISMMLFKAARFPARTDANGGLLTLEFQDRSLYRQDYIEWAWHFLKRSSDFENTTLYQLEAAISSYYTSAASFEDTNWKQILRLYDALVLHKPSPVVKMSRVVVLSKLEGPAKALECMEEIEQDMKGLQSFQALKADLYVQLENWNKARYHLSIAIREAENQTERRFLEAKLDQLHGK